VVDAAHIWEVFGSLQTLDESRFSRDEAKQVTDGSIDLKRTIVDLLVDQIEFADVVLLNKKDLVQVAERDKIEGLVHKLNPVAKIYWTERGVVPPDKVVGTNLFDFEKAQNNAGWLRELEGGPHTPETEEYGISSLVFRSKRPFVPHKLQAILSGFGSLKNILVNARDGESEHDSKASGSKEEAKEDPPQPFDGVIRSKGQVWLANCCAFKLNWHSVGRQFRLDPGQAFRAAVVEAGHDPRDEGYAEEIIDGGHAKRLKTDNNSFGSRWGDRQSELVLIGFHFDKNAMRKALEAALVPKKNMKMAGKEKDRFEKFIQSVRERDGDIGVENLTPGVVSKGTGGLLTPFHRFCQYEDVFFGGNAHRLFMEYRNGRRDEAFMRRQGVWHNDLAVTMTRENVVAGWGCIALKDIQKGAVLFRIPRHACFGAPAHDIDQEMNAGNDDVDDTSGSDDDDDDESEDTHKALALKILQEKRLGNKSEWKPFLDVLTDSMTPWMFPPEASSFLDGTELEPVLRQKIERLKEESTEENVDHRQEYFKASALAASHATPWFGVSIAPFCTTLNWSPHPNVEFDVAQDEEGREVLVGVAIRSITEKEELCQAYGESVAELVYRFGFLPQQSNGDVSPLEGDTVSLGLAILAEACGKSKGKIKTRTLALCQAGVLGESPWDGVDDVTAELSWADATKLDDGGASKLVGACLALIADKKSWKQARGAMLAIEGEHAEDFKSAALLATLLGLPTINFDAIATASGRADEDPWPRMLEKVRRLQPSSPNITAAVNAARRAVDKRLCLLNATEAFRPDSNASAATLQAWKLGQGLRKIEHNLLKEKVPLLAGGVPLTNHKAIKTATGTTCGEECCPASEPHTQGDSNAKMGTNVGIVSCVSSVVEFAKAASVVEAKGVILARMPNPLEQEMERWVSQLEETDCFSREQLLVSSLLDTQKSAARPPRKNNKLGDAVAGMDDVRVSLPAIHLDFPLSFRPLFLPFFLTAFFALPPFLPKAACARLVAKLPAGDFRDMMRRDAETLATLLACACPDLARMTLQVGLPYCCFLTDLVPLAGIS
jgi:G3E family GTPase